MNECQVRMGMVNTVNSWIGLKQSDGSHMTIIDLYNSQKTLPRNYKVKRNDAYCATTLSAAAVKQGLTDIIPVECSCGFMIQGFQAIGRWVENDAYIPDVADFVFYDWDDDGNCDCTGWPEHVGLVAEVDVARRILIISEGNMVGGKVGQREIKINARYIRGYGIPDYASKVIGTNKNDAAAETTNSAFTSNGINKQPKWVGQVTATKIPVRKWAGDEYNQIKSWPILSKGNLIDVCDTVKDTNGHAWYYIRIACAFYGFVDSSYITKAGTSGNASSSGTTQASTNAGSKSPTYKVGCTYTLQVELKVRSAPGTGSATKSYSHLTADGKKHDKDKDGCLDAGTVVTCKEIKMDGNDIWIKSPSGWLAAYYMGHIYIK